MQRETSLRLASERPRDTGRLHSPNLRLSLREKTKHIQWKRGEKAERTSIQAIISKGKRGSKIEETRDKRETKERKWELGGERDDEFGHDGCVFVNS